MSDLGFFFTSVLFSFLEGGGGLQEVVQTRLGEGSWVVGLVVIFPDSRVTDKIVDCWNGQDEWDTFADGRAHVRVCSELQLHIMFPVGDIVDG
jgi:hypothetical protein